jgi:flagellin
MRINHDIPALNAYNHYSIQQGNTTLSLKKLSSGLKINSAADNAALLAISEKMRSQTRGLSQSISNAYNGRNLTQTAEGALGQTHGILQRMRELAVQAANGTNTQSDRSQLQGEVQQLTSEINRISNDTEFNTMKLLTGSFERRVDADADTLYGSKLQFAPDSGFTDGAYNIRISGADGAHATAAIADSSNVVSGGTFNGGSVTVSNGAAFGDYALSVSQNANGTYTGRLTGPDGATATADFSTAASGGGPTTAAFGDISLDFSQVTSLNDGTLGINVSGEVRFDVTNAASGAATSYTIRSYAGGAVDMDGMRLADGVRAQADDTVGTDFTVTESGEALTLHVGANANQNIQVSLAGTSSEALGLNQINLTTQAGAEAAIGAIDEAINKISSERSRMGSVSNRLDHTIRSLSTTEENLTASESRIRDADMAKEILDLTRNNILRQASLSIMAQSRLMPQSILHLLQ